MSRRLRQLCRARSCAVFLALAASPGYTLGAAPPTAVVTMGDSYISGEAGRWLGNSANVAGSRDGTDRACVFTLGLCTAYDESRVYVDGSAKWGRAVSASTIAQGQIQELFHPNAYGQTALGTCVGALYAARRGSYACTGVPRSGPGAMVLTALP